MSSVHSQAFSAGVGNWVADEILHYVRIDPQAPVVCAQLRYNHHLQRHPR